MTNRSFQNKEKVIKSDICGCYYCLNIYKSQFVTEYIEDKKGLTAECPKCSIDSVVPYDEELDGSLHLFKMKLEAQHKKSFE